VTCSETDGKPLHKYESGDPESICGGCPLKKSKPDAIDESMRALVTTGFELTELKTSGAAFQYPDGLEAWEWMTLTALQRGKARADAADRKRREKKR